MNRFAVYISIIALCFSNCSEKEIVPEPFSGITHETFKNYQGVGYEVLTWKTYDYVTEECWNWLDSKEKDYIYLCFREDRIDFAEVEIDVDGKKAYGYRTFEVDLKDQDRVCIYLDTYTKMKVVEISDSILVMEGKHELHQQLQRVTLDLQPTKLPEQVKIKFSKK